MRNFYVRKDNFHYQFRENPTLGWSYFPDQVTDRKGMIAYFTANGSYDEPSIQFTDEKNQPVVYHELKHRGNIYVDTIENGDQTFRIYHEFLFSLTDQLSYFEHLEDDKSIEMQDKRDKLNYLKGMSDQETLDRYNEVYSIKTSDQAVKKYIEDHCKEKHNLPAVVKFE